MMTSTLLALLMKSLVVLGLVSTAALLLRRQSAAMRHTVWTMGIVSLLVLPIASVVFPALTLPEKAERMIPWPVSTEGPRAAEHPSVASSTEAPERDGTAVFDTPPGMPQPKIRVARWLIGVWSVGAILLLLRLAIGFAYVRHLKMRSIEVDDGEWLRMADDLSETLGLKRRPRLIWDAVVASPMTCGLLRPTVVLPTAAVSWPDVQRQIVLTHELGHVSRRDVLVTVLGRLVCALYWPNPLAWLAAWRLRVEGEYACDDVVLSLGTSGRLYASELLKVVRDIRADRAVASLVLPIIRRSELESRLRAILAQHRARGPVNRVAKQLVWFLTICLIVPLSAFRPTDLGPRDSTGVGRIGAFARAERLAVCEQDRWTTLDRTDVVATERYIRLLQSDNARDRKEAVNGLGNVGTLEAFPALAAALDDPDEQVRQGAAAALGNLGDKRALASLIRALADPDEHVRQNAAGALGDLGDRRALAPLLQTLASPDKHVRQSAATALGRLGDHGATTSLVSVLDDAEPHVAAAAAQALGHLGADQAADQIASLYDRSENRHVRLASARSLAQLGDRRGVDFVVATLRSDPEQFTRGEAAWALGAIGHVPAGENALLDALDDESRFVRYAAVCSLGRVGSNAALSPLRQVLSDIPQSEPIRVGIEWAIRQITSR